MYVCGKRLQKRSMYVCGIAVCTYAERDCRKEVHTESVVALLYHREPGTHIAPECLKAEVPVKLKTGEQQSNQDQRTSKGYNNTTHSGEIRYHFTADGLIIGFFIPGIYLACRRL